MNRELETTTRTSRRSFLAAGGALVGAAALAGAAETIAAPKLKVAIFSKHLRFLEGEQLAARAEEIGFDGVDILVRKGGHVAPERVRQDLPPLVAAIRRRGLEVPMITTNIIDAATPYALDMIATMADLDIRHYRFGGARYTADQPLASQIAALRPRAAKLAELNSRYRVCGMYHTHSGMNLVGASIWDLHEIFEGLDSDLIGVNFDAAHAVIEGGLGGWLNSFRIIGPYLKGVAIKDFRWEKGPDGNWAADFQPLGEGMVRYPMFFKELAARKFSGPLQLHFEYPLGGADSGKSEIAIPREQVFSSMKQDLGRLRSYLKNAGLA